MFMELNELSLHIFLSWNPRGSNAGHLSREWTFRLGTRCPQQGLSLVLPVWQLWWGGVERDTHKADTPTPAPEAPSSWLCGCRFEASLREDWGFPGSSVGKKSACNAKDPSSIPGWGRLAGEGIGYPLQCSWASLVAQLVKNPLAMQDPWVGKIPWRRERLPPPVFWPGEFYGLYNPRGQCPRGWRLSHFKRGLREGVGRKDWDRSHTSNAPGITENLPQEEPARNVNTPYFQPELGFVSFPLKLQP